jgi:hypothetical protein
MWAEAPPTIEGTLGERYLRQRRGLDDDLLNDLSGRVLRFHPDCPFGHDEKRPCLIALYRSIVTNEPVAIQRTALTSDGQKIDRKMFGPVGGAAIKLSADQEVECALAIGEGLETTIGAMLKGFRPAWSVGSDNGIRNFPLLPGIDVLTIIVDNDAPKEDGRRPGPDAASACSEKWRSAGREVFRVVPDEVGQDMADVIGGRNGRRE